MFNQLLQSVSVKRIISLHVQNVHRYWLTHMTAIANGSLSLLW